MFLFLFCVLLVLKNLQLDSKESKSDIQLHTQEQKEKKPSPVYAYGILLDSFIVNKEVVKIGDNVGDIWSQYNMYSLKEKILEKSKGIFDFSRELDVSNHYTVLSKKDTGRYFIYEKDKLNYIIVDARDKNDIKVYPGEKEITTKLVVTQGEITSSLSATCIELNVSQKLPQEISEIYAWTIDFFKIQKGDAFKVYYENNYIDSCGKQKYIGIGRILAAEFIHKNQKFYAFYYEQNKNYGEYFDENGMTLRKAFLKAPLNYYRISSRYSKNRKHPVTGQWKGHFGTDYAAPSGTAIMTTANGTIEVAGYTKNNGNYVKVKHNNIYTTQYLHMSKIESGIRKGVYVKQGDIIGYVGSTGLATGPHVCYRFWKNGVQVDPYKQDLPPGEPIKEENKLDFLNQKDDLMKKLMQQ